MSQGGVLLARSGFSWYAGLIRMGSERAGLFSGIIPISALFCGVLLGANTLTPLRMFGSALVAAGVIIGSMAHNPQKAI
ncbi:hypothetical protein KDA_67020 [Dictyobacter alpinus]|uniref:EamA domain-containing protein n=1 Tax=Dictyobacter alpinus TaxID=2014873 RepID=A0A402BII9_9CHLR|nr:hypothetical protein [Dictyobacter alpinus]GCE31218.1 hypothetical protein KDA_67020 [Dictyobacter alpinus]